jgi:hypothetical protein
MVIERSTWILTITRWSTWILMVIERQLKLNSVLSFKGWHSIYTYYCEFQVKKIHVDLAITIIIHVDHLVIVKIYVEFLVIVKIYVDLSITIIIHVDHLVIVKIYVDLLVIVKIHVDLSITIRIHVDNLVFSGVRVTRSLVSCVWFVDRCLSFCPFFLAIVLSVFRFTDSDYLPFVSSNSSYLCSGFFNPLHFFI